MISSMTGYGLSSSIEGDSEITIEIKGVNHKFLEISLKSHEINNDIDQYIRNAVGKNIVRGKVDIKIKSKSPSDTKYFIDTGLSEFHKICDRQINPNFSKKLWIKI